jgi:hypothetical protein
MVESSNTKAVGRLAGLAYLAIIVFSSTGYLTLARLLAGDSHIVLARLTTSHTLFTLAFVASVIGFAAWVVVGILLYRLMSSAGQILGIVMLIFVVAGAAASFNALSPLVPLVRSTSSGLDADALAPLVDSYNRRLLLAQVWSGLWLFPFGWLVLRSRIAPRLLGGCLIVGGISYLMNFATAFEPGLDKMMAYRFVSVATGILGVFVGEFGLCVWLLLKGARGPDLAPAA